MKKENIAIIESHSITEETFENLGEESIHKNVSSINFLNEIQGKGPKSIDQLEKDHNKNCTKKETLISNFCRTDDWKVKKKELK